MPLQMGRGRRGRLGSGGASAAIFALGFASAWELHSSVAAAQSGDAALAEELFQQGQLLMDAGRYVEACPKLAESLRLDPATGTLLNLAACHEKEGKLASAWTEYSEVVVTARREGREDRAAYAEERIRSIQPQLARLVIELPPAHDLKGMEIRLDGTPVGRPALGVGLPVDPGKHVVVVSAPEHEAWETTLDVPGGPSTHTVQIKALEKAPADPRGQGDQGATSPAGAAQESDGSTQRMLGIGTAAVGLVGVGLGTWFGLGAIDKNDESNQRGCTGNDCDATGTSLRNDARELGTWSTIAFAVGGTALGAGVILYLTAPSAPESERPPGAAPSKLQVRAPQAALRMVPAGATLQLQADF